MSLLRSTTTGFPLLNNVVNRETNPSRSRRAVLLLFEPLEAIGIYANIYSIIEKAPIEARKHWRMQIGPHIHDLHTDLKGSNTLGRYNEFASGSSSIMQEFRGLGVTDLTDLEVDNLARDTAEEMRQNTNYLGQYDMRFNNCQIFCQILAEKLQVPFSGLRLQDIPWSYREWKIWRELKVDRRGSSYASEMDQTETWDLDARAEQSSSQRRKTRILKAVGKVASAAAATIVAAAATASIMSVADKLTSAKETDL